MFKLLGHFRDLDKTEKFVYRNDKGIIEITWIKNKHNRDMDVFCLPTHYYCTLGCKFCHLTTSKKKQLMEPIEVDDLLQAFSDISIHIGLRRKILFSFMGVGEPFLNSTLIIDFYLYMKKVFFNNSISIALSTMVPTIIPFGYFIIKVNKYNIPLKIHFSLHSPIFNKRKELIPACSSCSIEGILKRLKKYEYKTASNPDIMSEYLKHHNYKSTIEMHYTIIEQVNDSKKELEELIKLGNKYNIRLKILKFNPTKHFKKSFSHYYWIKELFKRYNAPLHIYNPPGENIGSSCGQFTKHYYLSTRLLDRIKFLIWKQKYKVK